MTLPSVTDSPKAIGIREATDADLPSIVEIVNMAIESLPYIWTEIPTTVDVRGRWLDDHRQSGHPVLVATDADGSIVGWSSLSPFRGRDGYRFTAEVSVYVHPVSQRRGVGARLVRAVEDAARARSLHALVAVIDVEHAASLTLFERAGYVERGRLPEIGWKFGARRDEVFMVKLLNTTSSR